MLYKKYYSLLLGTLMTFFMIQIVHAQSEWSFNAGMYVNNGISSLDAGGVALNAGLEYKPKKKHLFSMELRTKLGHYSFNDGTEWATDEFGNENIPPLNPNEARVKYKLFTPMIGLVPKLHLHFNKPLSIFLENEFDIGLMTGRARYKGFDKRKKITEPIYCYNVGIGVEYEDENQVYSVSIGYSTLDFNDEIAKHKPIGYQEKIPNQHTPFYVSFLIKFSLKHD